MPTPTSFITNIDGTNNYNANIPNNSNVSTIDTSTNASDKHLFTTIISLNLFVLSLFAIAAVMFVRKKKYFKKEYERSIKTTPNNVIDSYMAVNSLPSKEDASYEIITTYQSILPYTENLQEDEAVKPVQNL
ncbi:hypothetical protein LY90DRAFT_508492 [Neocallimastix californiae]|uniref:Uncharacterized protein n=1 Tax=Neocallimastix californiae TaxID=1754190 RepID=A0A1Y2CUE0_9FUNG|nr:hypothetical protein LY90DRAFT_508492 [Neocallimastix californiae]|eukprot:ORY50659.1 hypothetical protein LY90DRAFT_508492 [Neocallimastix californiae]